MARKHVVIFDFDGTLADTVPLIRKIYADLALENKWRELTEEDYQELRKGTLCDAKRWSGMRTWEFPKLVWSARRLMRLEAEKVKLFPGMIELIKELRAHDIEVYILSRNSRVLIRHVLERYKLQNDVSILTRRTLRSKAAVITRLTLKRGYSKRNTCMVGDEVRDIQAARRARVKSIAVSWGLQDESLLIATKPTTVAHDVNELHNIILSGIKETS